MHCEAVGVTGIWSQADCTFNRLADLFRSFWGIRLVSATMS